MDNHHESVLGIVNVLMKILHVNSPVFGPAIATLCCVLVEQAHIKRRRLGKENIRPLPSPTT